jgi:uncharacterized protein (TIGR03435 family)
VEFEERRSHVPCQPSVAATRAVIDKTNLKGRYDLRLEFANEEGGDNPANSSRASIFTAIQEQLGLKLSPGKGPVEFFVVERVERPTAN